MRIGIDAHALGRQAGGNETFVRQLLHGLKEVAHEVGIVAYVNAEVALDREATAGFPTHCLAGRSSWVRVPFALPAAAVKTRVDLLHSHYVAPPVCPCPFVVTLHDLVWKRCPETLRALDRYRLAALVPGTLRRARRVFVVSRAMQQEAMEFYKVPAEKIDVVHNSLDPVFRPVTDSAELESLRARYALPERYVLYVGALQPRKNLVRLATAFDRLKNHGLDHGLVLAGKPGRLYDQVGPQLEALRLGDRLRFIGYVDRQALPGLLSAADALAYVSLYEGFGLPVLEGMACGAPVLTSTDPALVEVAGEAALTCDPTDVDAIEAGLVRILTDEELRRHVKAAGPARARIFSRAAMARSALEGYRRALA